MQTSRFQLGLVATLAVGLGFSLSSSEAVGYPAAAVSLGNNPVFSSGGNLNGSGSTSLSSLASPGSEMIITDVILSVSDDYANCFGNSRVTIREGSTTLASFSVGLSSDSRTRAIHNSQLVGTLRSGIRISAGVAPIVAVEELSSGSCSGGSMGVEYTVSGYYAQP